MTSNENSSGGNFSGGDLSHLEETTVSQRVIHKGTVVVMREDDARRPDGEPCIRDVVEHPGGVVVMPVLDSGEFLMVEQWRYPLKRTLLEFPAGKLDRDPDGVVREDPFDAIQRELEEETGYTASHWEKLNYLFTAPGFCDEKLWLYKATGLTPVANHTGGDEDEFIDLHRVSPEQAVQFARDGKITDAKTLALLFHYLAGQH